MSIKEKIQAIGEYTRINLNHSHKVEEAFKLGLWHAAFPQDCLDQVEAGAIWESPTTDFKIFFISDTGSSWHKFYRLWCQAGWRRTNVERDGSLLQYWMKISDSSKPEGYQELTLRIDITISTCKRVSKGFKQVEEFETVCEDLVEPTEDQNSSEFNVDFVEALNQRSSSAETKTSDEIPF